MMMIKAHKIRLNPNIRDEAVRLIRAGNGYIGALNSPVDRLALATPRVQ